MKDVTRYEATTEWGNAVMSEYKFGDFVTFEDYEVLQQQLTATTNILKSAGIEADTVQAGVMELVSRMNQVVAENAAFKDINAWCKTDAFENMYREFKTAEAIGCPDVDCMHDAMLTAIMHAPETPATDAYLNAVRAEGADAAAFKIRKAIPAFKDIHCGAVKECADIAEMVAVQFMTGSAGKDGSHE